MMKFKNKIKVLLIVFVLGSLSIFIKDATPSPMIMASATPVLDATHDVSRVDATNFMITPDAMQEVYRAFGPSKGDLKAKFESETPQGRPLCLQFIPKGHVLERMGFQDGDQLLQLNGKQVSSLKGLNGLFFILSHPQEVVVTGVHAGQPFVWTYRIHALAVSPVSMASKAMTATSQDPIHFINPFFYLSTILHAIF